MQIISGCYCNDSIFKSWTALDRSLAISWTLDGVTSINSAIEADRAAMQTMSPVRAMEFAMGRSCVRNSIKILGGEEFEYFRRNLDKGVDWPKGWTGSISHSNGIAVGCVGSVTKIQAIGVDLELNVPLPFESYFNLPDDIFIDRAKILRKSRTRIGFSARESAYKTLCSLGHAVSIFDMSIIIKKGVNNCGTFTVNFNDHFISPLHGQWLLVYGSMIMTIIIVRHDGFGFINI